MPRYITTVTGKEIKGSRSDFRDEGDTIVKKGWGYETRIPKRNVAEDTSVSGLFVVGAIAAGLALAALLSDD